MKARDSEAVEKEQLNKCKCFWLWKSFPLYVSKKSNEQVLNVLLIRNEEK